MRNNLLFNGVAEDNSTGSESPETTERRLRQYLQDAFKIQHDVADTISFERVHRSPGSPIPGKVRNIVAKFTYFKDRESVRKRWKELVGTVHRVLEQDVIEKTAQISAKDERSKVTGQASVRNRRKRGPNIGARWR
ncbi:hypothetical protein DPMN_147719 [Dreissena polymorpha]|uniref:Uncharacterized protein n=1 Tax=Dreissena polymorpha TaxID=45954 RepID=A0A9D4FB38_DREPO|nr:hypothetical protein DPMN_147719 [Dreissena polymorpha]